MRRLTLVVVVSSALALVGCSGGPAQPTLTPTPDATSSATVTAAPQATTVAPAPSEGPGSAEWEKLNDYDGVRTNDFMRLPRSIGDMTQKRIETNASKLEARAEYLPAARDAKAQVSAYFGKTSKGLVAVTGSKDAAFTSIVSGNARAFKGEGAERTTSAGGLDWSCVEGVQSGKFAHTICVAPKYGRVIDVQYIIGGDHDRALVDEFLAGIGEAVNALKK